MVLYLCLGLECVPLTDTAWVRSLYKSKASIQSNYMFSSDDKSWQGGCVERLEEVNKDHLALSAEIDELFLVVGFFKKKYV